MSAADIAIEIVGWAGAGLILAAYLMLSMGKVTGQSATYQWMNVIGAAGFVVNGWANGAMPSAALNVVWMGIGLVALSGLWRKRRRARANPE
jgi:Ca2+/Na+ antiporter